MPETYKFIISAVYVSFTYACIAIGALVYRQIIDNANQRNVALGEEVYLLFDPRVFAGIGMLFFFFCIFAAAIFTKEDILHEEVNRSAPGLLFFVVPMILVVNIIQFFVRGYWQRTSIRTNGILIRRVFSERLFCIEYQQLERVEVQNEVLWFRLLFYRHDGEQPLGICWVSKRALPRIMGTIQRNSESIITMPGNSSTKERHG